MAERDAELSQIRLAQIGKDGDIYVGRDEGVTVLAEPEPFQPFYDRLHPTLQP